MTNTDAGSPAKKGWEDWIAKTTAVLAVFAALSSGQWGASNLRAILEQGKVDDGWSYYQAKSIKNHLADHMKSLAAAMAADHPPAPGLARYREEMETESKRLSTEKAAIEKEVHGYEAARDGFVERSFWFEIAFACLQAGVVLSTIAAAAKKKGLWLTAMVAGILGALFVVNGMGHFVQTSEYSKKHGAKLGIEDPLKPPAK